MKKVISFITAILAVALLTASCGSGDTDTKAAATDASTQASTVAVTEKVTDAVTDAATEAATDAVTDAATDAVTDASEATEAAKVTEAAPADDKVLKPDTEISNGPKFTVTASDFLNMRYGPNSDTYDIIVPINPGEEVQQFGTSASTTSWIYIKYGDKYGWVNSTYLAPVA